MKFTFSLFAAFVSLGSVLASNVIELTPDNFDEFIGKGKPALVELWVLLLLITSVVCIVKLNTSVVLHHGVGIARFA